MRKFCVPMRMACMAILICLFHVTVSAQTPGREKAGARNPKTGKTTAVQRNVDSGKIAALDASRTSDSAAANKSRFADRITVTISPFAYQIFYIYLFSRKELDSGVSQSQRTSEKLYPSKTNILYAGNITLNDILGTGANASISYSGKYPTGFGVEDDTNSEIRDYGTRLFWPSFGLTAQWLDYRSFIRKSDGFLFRLLT